MTISRRSFLGLTGTAVTAAAVGTGIALSQGGSDIDVAAPVGPTATPSVPAGPTATPVPAAAGALPAVEDRVLVVVQMSGGNDGLNTLVPIANGRYHDLRPTLALDEADVIELSGATEMGLHPALGAFGDLWEAGHLAALQSIAMPEQSRSHFVALDTWWRGTTTPSASGGWLGRWLDATGGQSPDPIRAIAIGGGSPALTGAQSQPVIVQSLSGFDLRGPGGGGGAEAAFASMGAGGDVGLLGLAQAAIPVAVDSVDRLSAALGPATPGERDGSNVVASFAAAASVIEADLGTKVILVNLGGFDTHANQPAQHDTLLTDLATGLGAFYEALEAAGLADRALTMTFSEFGRRVAENGSGGTDHGRGGLAFLAGPAVAGSQILGTVDLGDLDDGDLRQQIDTRSLYANALDWLGGPTDAILGGSFDRYEVLRT